VIDLTGKSALVTGGSRGIGRAIVLRLATQGANVAFTYKGNAAAAAETVAAVEGLGRKAVAIQADASDPESAEGVVKQALETFGKIDILVNNAGVTRDGVLARMSDDDWRAVLDTNLGSVFYTCRAVTRGMMRRRSGAIVNVSSIVGVHGNWGQSNYAASKAGIIGFTKSLAQELGSRGVRANVVAPGYITTRLTEVIPEQARAKMLDLTPLGRLGDPEDVAGAVRFLCSDEAAFITGEVLLVSGGLGM
jgi:3-oxoacyl-[acyl-carrier protein] reductase